VGATEKVAVGGGGAEAVAEGDADARAPVAEPLQVFAVFCAKEGEVAPAIRASQANARIQRARNPEAAPNRSGTASARFPNEAIPPKKYPSPR
jgi:hypothetical protein